MKITLVLYPQKRLKNSDYIRHYPKDKFSIIKENKIQIMKAIIYKKVTKEGNDYKGSAQEKIYFLGIPVFCSTKELNER